MLTRTLLKLIQRLTRRQHWTKGVPFTERLSNRERQDVGMPRLPDPWVNPHVLPPSTRRDHGNDESL